MTKLYVSLFSLALFLYNLFPSWMLPMQNEALRLPIPRLLIFIIIGGYAVTNTKSLITLIEKLCRDKFVRYILYFTIFEIIALFFILLFQKQFKYTFLLSILMRMSGSLLIVFLGVYIGIKKDINFLIKFIFYLLISIYLYGLFDFFIYFFHINQAESILKFFMNARNSEKIILLGFLPRIQAGFEEAAYYSYFVILTLPLTYYFYKSNYKILKNKYLSLVLKKCMPLLAWLTLILSQSPIYCIFAVIISLVYYLIRQKTTLQNKMIKFTGCILIFILLLFAFCSINFGNSFLGRIQNVISNFGSFKLLVIVEPSLATRICSYVNMFCLFLKHPILGCGTGNLSNVLTAQFQHSPLPITPEIYIKSIVGDAKLLNASVLFSTLAEQGIIGTLLYYIAFISLITRSFKYDKLYSSYQKEFIIHLRYVLIVFLAFSFYESFSYFQIIWLISAFLLSIFYQTKNIMRQQNENYNS